MNMRRCLIIGSNGYIGRHLKWYLEQQGIIPECYDIAECSANNYTRIDLTDIGECQRINLNVDYIFMFVGLAGTYVGFDTYEKYVSVNELSLLNLLDTIRRSSYRPKVIFPSTRLVYKGADKPLKEEDEKECRTIYAVNKLSCEGLLQAYKYSFDINYTVFRICVPYGNLLSGDYSFGTIGFFLRTAMAGNDIALYGGGIYKRTFTHIQDLCYQVVEGAFKVFSDGGIYNVGGETYSLFDLANIIAAKYNVGVLNLPWPDNDFRIESGHTYFDDLKIKNLIDDFEYQHLVTFI